MTTVSTNPYFIIFQRFECYTTLIVKELLCNNEIKFFISISKSDLTYITIAITNISSNIPCWSLLHRPYVNAGPFNAGSYRRYFSNVYGQALINKRITPAFLTPYHEK